MQSAGGFPIFLPNSELFRLRYPAFHRIYMVFPAQFTYRLYFPRNDDYVILRAWGRTAGS